MFAFNWNDIPGYREAAIQDEREREMAWLELPHDICGISCQPLTLRHLQMLRAINSPFIYGRSPCFADVAVFLWIVSESFVEITGPMSKLKRFLFNLRLRRKIPFPERFLESVAAIEDYISLAFRDSPGGGATRPGECHWCFSGMMMGRFVSRYGWTTSVISNMPLRQCFQLLNVIRKLENPDTILFSYHTSRVKTAWRRKQMEEAQKQKPPEPPK